MTDTHRPTRILIIHLDDPVYPAQHIENIEVTTLGDHTIEAAEIDPEESFHLSLCGEYDDAEYLLKYLDLYRYLPRIISGLPATFRVELSVDNCYLDDNRLHQLLTRLQTDEWSPLCNVIDKIYVNNNQISLEGFRELLTFIADHCPNCHRLDSIANLATTAELQTLPQPPQLMHWNDVIRIRPTHPQI